MSSAVGLRAEDALGAGGGRGGAWDTGEGVGMLRAGDVVPLSPLSRLWDGGPLRERRRLAALELAGAFVLPGGFSPSLSLPFVVLGLTGLGLRLFPAPLWVLYAYAYAGDGVRRWSSPREVREGGLRLEGDLVAARLLRVGEGGFREAWRREDPVILWTLWSPLIGIDEDIVCEEVGGGAKLSYLWSFE